MLRIQAHRLHRSLVALTGAAIVATTLMTSVAAAAAPDEGLEAPVSSEIVAIKRKLHFPLADLSVTPLSLSHDAGFHDVHYRFRITNNGPEAISFKYEMKAYWQAYGQPNGTQDGGVHTATRGPGGSIDVDMHCTINGEGHNCNGADIKVSPTNGFDTNQSNNTASMSNSF
jgi:hypothetical protein